MKKINENSLEFADAMSKIAASKTNIWRFTLALWENGPDWEHHKEFSSNAKNLEELKIAICEYYKKYRNIDKKPHNIFFNTVRQLTNYDVDQTHIATSKYLFGKTS